MKKIFAICSLMMALKVASAQSSTIYYTPVQMPPFLKNAYYGMFDPKLLSEDLAQLLHKATGKNFNTAVYTKEAKTGIFLLLDSSKKKLGNETGSIESDGKKFIKITSGYTTGISYALYSWLQEIGFRFYLPGELWENIPTIRSVFPLAKKKTYKPYFHVRMFNASGGFPVVKELDENNFSATQWQQWYIRNRMGCDYISIGGHIGEAFNITHKKEIEADSLIVAPTNGKRKYSSGSKLDPTYKKGVEMYSSWIADEAVKDAANYPAFLPFRKYFTADMGDGLGYCHTEDCERNFKSVSDQSFSIVNEAARKVRVKNPLAGVSTLAYSERADTPSISIEKNVHVEIVANAFQSVGTPAELVKRWTTKSKNISIYDYLNIAQWRSDMPFYNLDRYFNNLQFLKKSGIEGISYETSESKFSSGLLQYFILKFLCNPYTSPEKELEIFCKNNFGAAYTPVYALLKEWYFSDEHAYTNLDYPSFYEEELGRFIQYMETASATPGINNAIKQRIEELKLYIVYLCKYNELYASLTDARQFANDASLRNKKTEALLEYTWQLYASQIFHNTQLNEVLKRTLPDQQKDKWNFSKSEYFANFRTEKETLLATAYEEAKKKYLPLAQPYYTIPDTFFQSLSTFSADSIRIVTTDETALPDFSYPLDFYCTNPCTLKIRYYTSGSAKKKNYDSKTGMISVEGKDYNFVQTNFLEKENETGIISYVIPAKGHYRLFLAQYNATHIEYIIYPGNCIFYHHKKSLPATGINFQSNSTAAKYANRYLACYAPLSDSLRFRNIMLSAKTPAAFYDGNGNKLPVKENVNLLYNSVALPPGQKVPVVFFDNSQYRWPPVLINTASYFFFLKFPLK